MTKILTLNPDNLYYDIYNNRYFYDENTKREQYDYFYVDIIQLDTKEGINEKKIATVMVQCNDKDDLLYNDEYIVDVVTYDYETQEINGQLDQSRYNRNMEVINGLEMPVIDDITTNGDTLDEYILRMLGFIFMADTNPNLINPEKYEVIVSYKNKEPRKIRHRGCFAYDGCHKIYVCENIQDVYTMLALGYDLYPIEELKTAWQNSCPLRFIHPASCKGEDILPQGVMNPKILAHKLK